MATMTPEARALLIELARVAGDSTEPVYVDGKSLCSALGWKPSRLNRAYDALRDSGYRDGQRYEIGLAESPIEPFKFAKIAATSYGRRIVEFDDFEEEALPATAHAEIRPEVGIHGQLAGPSALGLKPRAALRRSRVQLLDLQRDIEFADLGSLVTVAAHVQDVASGLSPGDLQDQLRGHAIALKEPALSEQRRAVALHAVAAVCRRLHREATFQASPPVDDVSYGLFLRAAVQEDGKLSIGSSISVRSIEKRSRLPAPAVHAAIARSIDEDLAYVSDVDEQAYSIQINQEDVEHALRDLERGAPRNHPSADMGVRAAGGRPPPSTGVGCKATNEWTSDIADYRSKVHFAIITIKPEEEDEVIKRFPRQHTVRGERDYGLCRIENAHGNPVLVASVRQPKQGNVYAAAVTKDVVNDLDPDWILLVGIAGASPFGAAVLGDVVLGTHVHDLTVHVRDADGSTAFSGGGGAATVDVEATVVHLRSTLQQLMNVKMPATELNLEKLTYTTKDEALSKKIAGSLTTRFAGGYAPKVLDGPVISTDALVKDVDLVKQWVKLLRNAQAIEMESAGAYNAARTRAKTYAMLPIRGISDIVGLEKQEGWVLHACKVAAECASEFVRHCLPPEAASNRATGSPDPELVERVPQLRSVQKAKATLQHTGLEQGRSGGPAREERLAPSSQAPKPPPGRLTEADLKEKLATPISDCRKVKTTIQRFKWPLVRAVVELSVFRDDSPRRAARRVPLADLALELGRTPESIEDYLNDLTGLGYLDIDEDGVCLSGHADSFTKLARALAKELGAEGEERAGDLFDELLA
jgi:nucleoside phosphorylase